MTACWSTKKTAAGYEFRVFSVGYQVQTITHVIGLRSTRAQAVGAAKRAVMQYRNAR